MKNGNLYKNNAVWWNWIDMQDFDSCANKRVGSSPTTAAFGVFVGSNPTTPASSLVGNQWTIEKGIIDESKDVAWIKQRYHSKSILQDFGYITTLTEIILLF